VTAPADPYKEALERLYGLERGNKGPFGLEGTRALLEDLGHPERAFKSIHVAGTNGKGSTCAFLERILRAGRALTGLFTSPHLIDFRERIRIDGRSVAPDVVTRDLARIVEVPAGTGRTFFEATFALGALAFASEKVEVAVLETGLGGRLDSTNVVTPELCVITPIGLDHQDMLGDTIEAIAAEKAGIIKPGVPVVVGRQEPAAMRVLEQRARDLGAPFYRAEDLVPVTHLDFDRGGSDVTMELPGRTLRVRPRMIGFHQILNAVLATAAALVRDPDLSDGAITEGLSRARWPGRFEHCPKHPRIWWDGAHNPQGARALTATWMHALRLEPAVLVLGVSADKDLEGILNGLDFGWTRVLTVQAHAPRALDATVLAERVRAVWPWIPVAPMPDVAAALASTSEEEAVLVCGSLFVVGEAMAACGAADLEQL
jgi:dihydrofolate synthase/folylpolyglutamate synthase